MVKEKMQLKRQKEKATIIEFTVHEFKKTCIVPKSTKHYGVLKVGSLGSGIS